jgi:(p)ppGpp synthase/HD superfamily hydrolase
MLTLEAATGLARRAHAGQVDKAGVDYLEHAIAVRDALEPYGVDAQIAGVLHDVLEDTTVTVAELRAAGVPAHVLVAVESVTRRPGETYMTMIRRAAADPLGRLVKLADNRHNSDEARLGLLPADQATSLRRRYAEARELLEDPFKDLIERSSLGTPAARALRHRTPRGVAAEALRRARLADGDSPG